MYDLFLAFVIPAGSDTVTPNVSQQYLKNMSGTDKFSSRGYTCIYAFFVNCSYLDG